jgi:hypothetical protein
LKQEQELVADTGSLLMANFLLMGWTFAQIVAVYDISEPEGIQLLAKLDRMKLIQLLPGNQVKMLVASNFEWIAHGPIEKFFESLDKLHGGPVNIKENFDIKMQATTNRLEQFQKMNTAEGSPVIANIKNTGAALIERTNIPEFSIL